MSQILWVFAGPLFILAFALFYGGTESAGGIFDYRAWFLLVVGLIVATPGNVSGSSGPRH